MDIVAGKSCKKHTMINCPTAEWKPGVTAICTTARGALVFARVYTTPEAAAEHVAAENRIWNSTVARYTDKGLPLPVQFTEAGRLRHVVWQGEDKPTVDAWGKVVQ